MSSLEEFLLQTFGFEAQPCEILDAITVIKETYMGFNMDSGYMKCTLVYDSVEIGETIYQILNGKSVPYARFGGIITDYIHENRSDLIPLIDMDPEDMDPEDMDPGDRVMNITDETIRLTKFFSPIDHEKTVSTFKSDANTVTVQIPWTRHILRTLQQEEENGLDYIRQLIFTFDIPRLDHLNKRIIDHFFCNEDQYVCCCISWNLVNGTVQVFRDNLKIWNEMTKIEKRIKLHLSNATVSEPELSTNSRIENAFYNFAESQYQAIRTFSPLLFGPCVACALKFMHTHSDIFVSFATFFDMVAHNAARIGKKWVFCTKTRDDMDLKAMLNLMPGFFETSLLHLQNAKPTGLPRLYHIRFGDFLQSIRRAFIGREYYIRVRPYIEILAYILLQSLREKATFSIEGGNQLVCTLPEDHMRKSARDLANKCRQTHQTVETILTIHRWIPLND
jgi:hypothetical protein